MLAFEFHFKPNGQQVHASYESFPFKESEHMWVTRSYIHEGRLQCHSKRQAIQEASIGQLLDHCLAQDTERVILYAEDCTVNIQQQGERFRLVSFDAMSGDVFRNDNINREQVRAIVLLCIYGDDHKESFQFYPAAEQALDGCQQGCRPIP